MSWQQDLWPEWKIENQIGSGASGSVYRIKREDASGVYYAALKVIIIDSAEVIISANNQGEEKHTIDYFSFAEEISQEIVFMEKLKGNSNIVSYEDHKIVFHEDDKSWVILLRMEFLTSLTDHIQSVPCSEQDAIRMGRDICKALELCEKQNIIHRDVKPSNIFYSEFGEYKLGDFSIALITEHSKTEHDPVGTYYYMAPEVYYNKTYNKTVDLYSLGLIMYRMLNDGRPPFMPQNEAVSQNLMEFANLRRLKGENLPEPDFASEELSKVILKACAFKPEDRFQSAKEMRKSLAECGRILLEKERVQERVRNSHYFKTAGDL